MIDVEHVEHVLHLQIVQKFGMYANKCLPGCTLHRRLRQPDDHPRLDSIQSN